MSPISPVDCQLTKPLVSNDCASHETWGYKKVRSIKKKDPILNLVCADCFATATPLWRKGNFETLCNACGIRFRKGPRDNERARQRDVERARQRDERAIEFLAIVLVKMKHSQ